jgi:hypothetical protein
MTRRLDWLVIVLIPLVASIAPSLGHAQITQIIDSTGDGGGNTLAGPFGIAVDASGNAFVGGAATSNVFKITSGGVITEIIDGTGDGGGNPSRTRLTLPWTDRAMST